MPLNQESLSDQQLSELGQSIFNSFNIQKNENDDSTCNADIEYNLKTTNFKACRDENGTSMIIISPDKIIPYQIAHLKDSKTMLISLNDSNYNHYVIFAVNKQIIYSYDDYKSICGNEKSFTLSLINRFDPGYAKFIMAQILLEYTNKN